jgi:hypothetical protein
LNYSYSGFSYSLPSKPARSNCLAHGADGSFGLLFYRKIFETAVIFTVTVIFANEGRHLVAQNGTALTKIQTAIHSFPKRPVYGLYYHSRWICFPRSHFEVDVVALITGLGIGA